MKTIDVFNAGKDITGRAASAVVTSRFLRITGNSTDGVIAVGHATAAGRICGVAKVDAAIGQILAVARGNSRVVKVTTSGAIAAFAEVEVGANGTAVTKTTGVAVGYALTAAASGADAQISLY